jgi:hypothetical protein
LFLFLCFSPFILVSLTCHRIYSLPGPEYVEGFLSSSFHKHLTLTQVCPHFSCSSFVSFFSLSCLI